MSYYSILGLMSGTSMDGLDIVHITFYLSKKNEWTFKIHNKKTYPYKIDTINKLKKSKNLSTIEILEFDKYLGKIFSNHINNFIKTNKINKKDIHAIGSHGHTVHHRPDIGFTQQIGCGDTIAFNTGINVVNNFRQKDIIANGQGAPLVPIGDKLLFIKKANAFLNIGGFVNICVIGKKIIAFDICPGNLPLNKVINKLGLDFDNKGILSSQGKINIKILHKLNSLKFYDKKNPKSLGTEWLEKNFFPIINKINSPEDQLRTIIEHIAIQVSNTFKKLNVKKIYITGGGALNEFLISRIKANTNVKIIIPNKTIINYKEAIIFGFLSVLFLRKEINCLADATGANKDTIGGVLHIP